MPDSLDLQTQIGVYLEDVVAFALTEPFEGTVRHVHPATGFDPQALGAKCALCPLRHPSRPPVGADLPADGLAPDFAIVGEAPGPTETQSGRPFDGPSGRLLEQLGIRAGLHRGRALVTNAVACMPPGMDFGTFEARYHLENSDRRRADQQPLPHPMDCCRPRLEAELRGIRDVISMGARGMNALLPGTRKSLDALRGGPLVLRRDAVGGKWVVEGPDGPTGQIAGWEERRLLPTVHPARLFPGREPKWTGPFISDMAKAVRFFAGRLTWVDPPYVVNPPVEEIMRFLGVVWRGGQFEAPPELARTLSYDFEADRREPLLANVRCLGIGNRQGSVVAAFLSRDGRTRFWSPEKEEVVKRIIRAWALGPGLKIGWNSEGWDSLLFWAWMGIVPTPQLDGMIVQKDLEPEMPHSLGYAGSVLTDVRAWKAGKEAVDDDEVKDDESLFRYNNVDVAVTQVCTEVYAAEAARRGLLRWTPEGRLDPNCIIGLDHEKARVCRTMHINGMLVDQAKRAELYAREADKVEKHAAACRKIAEDPSLNINSNAQIARLLFSRACWHLPYNPEYTTAAGLPSVSEPQTRWLLQQAFLGDQQRAWLMAYRRCKAADKLKGTYLSRTAPVLEDEERVTEARTAENKAAIALLAARDLWPRAGADVWVPFAGPAERVALMAALYEDWGLAPVRTKTGKPSASRDSLVRLWQRGVQDVPRRFLSAILSYRRHLDEVKRLRKPPEEEEYERCTIWEDGRVHAQWKAIGAATGRLASQPNMQNIPRSLRSMFVAGPGHLFVSADSDQLELRIAASRWQATRYLEAFAAGLDPHQVTMQLIWGDEIWSWEGAPRVPFFKNSRQAARVGKNGNNGAWEIHGYFDRQRDLAKRVQYACSVRGTRIAVLDARGDVPIEELQAGDWVLAWSRARRRIEPARVSRAWRTGSRPCLRVTFKYRGKRYSETFTADHRFMLRTGDWRMAGDLAPGDRLMPFKRWTDRTGYRTLDAYNDGKSRLRENRVAVGRYGRDDRHVHHKDENPANNCPENLECLSPRDHWSEHANSHFAATATSNAVQWAPEQRDATNARLAEGRRLSTRWLAAVREGQAARTEEERHLSGQRAAETRRVRGTQRHGSAVDAFAALVGTVPDSEVAVLAGVTPEAVGYWRKKRGILSYRGCRRQDEGTAADRVLAQSQRLGKETDAAIAADCRCTRKAVAAVRERLGIPRAPLPSRVGNPGHPGLREPRGSALDPWRVLAHVLTGTDLSQLAGVTPPTITAWRSHRGARLDKGCAQTFRAKIGYVPDAEVARTFGGTVDQIAKFRRLRGIPAYWEEAPGQRELNHEVVEVTVVEGAHEVWDIEVEHEDHNFALASGIFVHNSQYAADLPTVYNVITSATDKEGELIFLHLTLDDVERMHTAWLKHCPEFPRGWEQERDFYRKHGYTMEPVGGRCFYFLDGEDLNKLANLWCQGAGANIIDQSMLAMDAQYPFRYAGVGTGFVAQVHDKLTLEVLAADAATCKEHLESAMQGSCPGLPGVTFSADGDSKAYWG